jgi:hypothetical protein
MKRYKRIAEILKNSTDYLPADAIAKDLNLTTKQVRSSIKPAKEFLAGQGLIVTNKLGSGYKIGDFDDLEIEAAKSCIRSYSQLKAIFKRAMAIKHAGRDGDYSTISQVVGHNLAATRFIIKQRFNFNSDEDYSEYLAKVKITPDFLAELADI